ncbi:unnamed protein product, partial [Lymnaea stagnalis]
DSSYSQLCFSTRQCLIYHSSKAREDYENTLKQLWNTPSNPNPVIPCLCVRTGLDLYLRVKNFHQDQKSLCLLLIFL